MRLKSYFVHTMEEALQAAKIELGEDAMLVDSKPLAAPDGGRARLEVIFAAAATPPPPPKVPAMRTPLSRAESIGGLQRFRGELTTLLDALNRNPDTSRLEPLSPARPQLDALRARLLQSEVPSLMADEVVASCRPVLEGLVLRGDKADEAEEAIVPLLAAEWPHALDAGAKASRVMAFVGPTGAGKTSAIAKLAFHLGVAKAQTVQVLSIDNLRIGASDQLAHICALLGVPFQSLDFSGSLQQVLSGSAGRGIVLIDTPGYGQGDVDVMADTAEHLSRVDSVQCHLVLPATLRYREMLRRREHFQVFSPSRLLFTRLDETEFFGPAWSLARASRLPVEWVSTGAGIPEDIEEADASQIARAVLGKQTYFAGLPEEQPAANLASAASAGASRI